MRSIADIVFEDVLALALKLSPEDQKRLVDQLSGGEAAYSAATEEEIPPAGTLARLAWASRQVGFRSEQTDTSERSRQLLNEEFPKYTL